MTALNLASQIFRFGAKHRLAASSVAPVYASASSYTHSCVIPNANAYRFSRPADLICSDGDR
jgi:hypothetical protein